MNEKDYKKWIKRIDLLMDKKSKIKTYNLSGSGWKDYASSREVDKLMRRNERAESKTGKIDSMIAEILEMLESAGYNPDEIMEKYNGRDER